MKRDLRFGRLASDGLFLIIFRQPKVCKVKKALYGLKQTPRAWYDKIVEYIKFYVYLASNSDACLFVKKKERFHVFVLLYVVLVPR